MTNYVSNVTVAVGYLPLIVSVTKRGNVEDVNINSSQHSVV